MKSKYTKKNNRNREYSGRKVHEEDIMEDNLLERILAEEGAFKQNDDEFEIDIIGMTSEESEEATDVVSDFDDEFDEDMANRLSLYESINDDDEEEEIKEFVSRDVVAESRKRVNQPGRRKFEASEKTRRERPKREKQHKKSKEKKSSAEGGLEDKKSIIDTFKEVYGKYTMNILYSALGMLAIILIIAIIVVPKDENKGGSRTDSTSAVDKQSGNLVDGTTDNMAGDSTEEGSTEKQITMNDLSPEGEDTEIHKVIAGFLDAERVQCDIEKAKAYFEKVPEGYSLEKYEMMKRYVEAYEDIKCYKFDYLTDGMYYVFVTYKNKIANIDTLTVAGEGYVVRYNKEQGKYLIVTSYTKEEYAYKIIVENSPEVKVLNEDVLKRHNEAIASDTVLKEFIEIMQGANKSTEQTSTEN